MIPKKVKLIKKLLLLIVSFISMSNYSWAQNQGINNTWLMGYASWAGSPYGNCRFNFFSGSLIITPDSLAVGLFATEANMSDTSGNLLFYSNGFEIDDSIGNIMLNGDSISPSGFKATQPVGIGLYIPQANLALKVPNSNHLYYLFHCTFDDAPNYATSLHLYYSIIDMNGNGGKGEVIQKNTVLVNDSINPGKIVACKHGNGRDWWVTCLKSNSDLIYKFLVTPYGITGPYTQNIGIARKRGFGQCKFSPDGTKFAYCLSDYTTTGDMEIMTFDRCTGQLSNPVYIQLPQSTGFGGGCAFSPNSQLLYISNVDSVYQYDLTIANIASSKIVVAAWDSFYSPYPPFATLFYTCQNAPDGKIYLSTGNGTKHLHVINYPDSIGLACDLVQHAVALPYFYSNSLPNHPNYFLGRDTGSACDTITAWMGEQNQPPPKEVSIKILSNPNNGRFTLWFPVNKDAGWLEIYNTNGKVIRKLPVSPWSQYKQVDITAQPAGVYFCRMQWGDVTGSAKVIKET